MIDHERAGGRMFAAPNMGRVMAAIAVAMTFITCSIAANWASMAEAQSQEWKTTPMSQQSSPPSPPEPLNAKRSDTRPPIPARAVKRKAAKPAPVSVEPTKVNAKTEAAPKKEPVEVSKPVLPTSETATSTERASGRIYDLVREYCISSKEQIVEARLRRQKAIVGGMTEELKAKISELEKLVEESQARVSQLESFSAAISKQIVAVYAGMEPDAAAKQIAGLDPTTGAAIISKLDGQRASAIVSEMSPKDGARIISHLTQLARMSARPTELAARAGQQQ